MCSEGRTPAKTAASSDHLVAELTECYTTARSSMVRGNLSPDQTEEPDEVPTLRRDELTVRSYVGVLLKGFERRAAWRVHGAPVHARSGSFSPRLLQTSVRVSLRFCCGSLCIDSARICDDMRSSQRMERSTPVSEDCRPGVSMRLFARVGRDHRCAAHPLSSRYSELLSRDWFWGGS